MTSPDPDVMVIVPLFNRRRFLPQLFRTLGEQTYPNFEIILVDDGSTDGTEHWVRSHQDELAQPIRYLRQQNAGPYSARNLGLAHATAEYIAFLDSDDEWPEYHLEDLSGVLQQQQDIDWLFGALCRIDHDSGEVLVPTNLRDANGTEHPFLQLMSEPRGEVRVIEDTRVGEYAIRHCVPGSMQCALIRRNVFEQLQFDESYRTAYDRFFAMKCALMGLKFAFVDKVHQIYHVHNEHISLVSDVTPSKLEASAHTMLRGYHSLGTVASRPTERAAIKEQLARVYAWELSLALRQQGRWRESSRAMLHACYNRPSDWRYFKSLTAAVTRQFIPLRFLRTTR